MFVFVNSIINIETACLSWDLSAIKLKRKTQNIFKKNEKRGKFIKTKSLIFLTIILKAQLFDVELFSSICDL